MTNQQAPNRPLFGDSFSEYTTDAASVFTRDGIEAITPAEARGLLNNYEFAGGVGPEGRSELAKRGNVAEVLDHVAVQHQLGYRTGIVIELTGPGPMALVSFFATRKIPASVEEVPADELNWMGSPTKADPDIYVTGNRDVTKFYAPALSAAVEVFHFQFDRPEKIGVNWSAIGTVSPAQAAEYARLITAASTFAAELHEWAVSS